MEPIGTITNYYPFLTTETREIVESLVDNAISYRDFVRSLLNRASAKQTTNELLYLAVLHTWHLNDDEMWLKALLLCEKNVIIKPWKYWDNPNMTSDEFQEGYQLALDQAISARPDDWMLLHLGVIGVHLCLFISSFFPPDWQKYATIVEDLVKTRPELRCFETHTYYWQGYLKRLEGDNEGALKDHEEGLRLAEEHDDQIYVGYHLDWIATTIMNSDPRGGFLFFQRACRVYESLGARKSAASMMQGMSDIHTILGEYSSALELIFEGMDIARGSLESPSPTSTVWSTSTAHIYCDLNMGEQAREWLKWRDESLRPDIQKELADGELTYHLQLALARTLIHLHKNEEAAEYLDKAHTLILEWGFDEGLALYYYVRGLLEMASNDSKTALQTLENSLKAWQKLNSQMYINRCLLALAKAESIMAAESDDYSDITSSGRWMSRLEEHAREKNYPGIRMQHALLKSKYQAVIDEHEAAKFTLKDALTFSDSPGVEVIRERITDRLEEMEEILQ